MTQIKETKYFFLLISLLVSCKVEHCNVPNDFTKDYILSIDFEAYHNGNYYKSSSYEISLKAQNKEYYRVPIYYLYSLNSLDEYKKYEFEEFICGILNESILMNTEEIENLPNVYKININPYIEKEIINLGLINVSIEHGAEKKEEKVYTLSSDSARTTLLFYFYKEGYLSSRDDSSGKYVVVKAEKLLDIEK